MWDTNDTSEILRALQVLVTYNMLLSLLLVYIFFRDCTIYYRRRRRKGQGRPKRSVDKAVREGDFVSLLRIAATTPADIVGLREDESVDRQPVPTHYFNHSTYTRFYEANFGKIRSEMVAYCPEVFDRLRSVHDVSLEEISQAFSTGNKLSKGEGKSMAQFMVSTDKRFCMKTINSSEKTVLLNMLPSYFEHVMKYPKTSLLCRMLGLFRLRYGGVDTFFLLMMNISRQDVSCRRIVKSFDLKGSLRSRRVCVGEKRSVMKDINWVEQKMCVDVSSSRSTLILEQLQRDARFLENCGIMDYSLLVIIYDDDDRSVLKRACCFARRCFGIRSKGEIGVPIERSGIRRGTRTYRLGIIDILQNYNSWKSAENRIKSIGASLSSSHRALFKNNQTAYTKAWVRRGSQLHSAIDPKGYRERFFDFMRDHVFHRPMCHVYQRSCVESKKKKK